MRRVRAVGRARKGAAAPAPRWRHAPLQGPLARGRGMQAMQRGAGATRTSHTFVGLLVRALGVRPLTRPAGQRWREMGSGRQGWHNGKYFRLVGCAGYGKKHTACRREEEGGAGGQKVRACAVRAATPAAAVWPAGGTGERGGIAAAAAVLPLAPPGHTGGPERSRAPLRAAAERARRGGGRVCGGGSELFAPAAFQLRHGGHRRRGSGGARRRVVAVRTAGGRQAFRISACEARCCRRSPGARWERRCIPTWRATCTHEGPVAAGGGGKRTEGGAAHWAADPPT